jgi:hypothetical protein
VAFGKKGKVLLKKDFMPKQLITFRAKIQTALIRMGIVGSELSVPCFERTGR